MDLIHSDIMPGIFGIHVSPQQGFKWVLINVINVVIISVRPYSTMTPWFFSPSNRGLKWEDGAVITRG